MDKFEAQRKAFELELEKIELRHEDFFKGRRSKFDSKEHDSLANHYMIIENYQSGKINFNIYSEELPESIKIECLEAFRKIYPK